VRIFPIANHSTLPDMPSQTNDDHDARYVNLANEGTNVTGGTFSLTTTGLGTWGALLIDDTTINNNLITSTTTLTFSGVGNTTIQSSSADLFLKATSGEIHLGDGGSNNTLIGITGNLTQEGTAITTLDQLYLNEITTPTAVPNDGAIYTKTDNSLYFQDGAGTEHLVHGNSLSTKTNTDYTLVRNDGTVLFSTGSTSRTANLPAASTVSGETYTVKKIDSAGGTVTIDPDGSETIDGGLTAVITVQFESITFQSDGSNWHIL